MTNTTVQTLDTTFDDTSAGTRLDSALAKIYPEYSREQIKKWIQSGNVLVDNKAVAAKMKVVAGQSCRMTVTHTQETSWLAQDIKIDVHHEEADFLIINKSPGLTVHPGAGQKDGTLANALLHYDSNLSLLPRSGIIHRLDKNTSGLLLIARTNKMYTALNKMMSKRQIERVYQAVVSGCLTGGKSIDFPIGRHPHYRTKMAVRKDGRPAISHIRILEKFSYHTHVRVKLETGRTHQIRVHMSYIGHPIVGDKTYAGSRAVPKDFSDQSKNVLQSFNRQALHACKLGFLHPISGKHYAFKVPPPDDYTALLEAIRWEQKEQQTSK